MITVMFVLYEFLIFSIKWATINDILDIVEWQELLLFFFFLLSVGDPQMPQKVCPPMLTPLLWPCFHSHIINRQNEHH